MGVVLAGCRLWRRSPMIRVGTGGNETSFTGWKYAALTTEPTAVHCCIKRYYNAELHRERSYQSIINQSINQSVHDPSINQKRL